MEQDTGKEKAQASETSRGNRKRTQRHRASARANALRERLAFEHPELLTQPELLHDLAMLNHRGSQGATRTEKELALERLKRLETLSDWLLDDPKLFDAVLEILTPDADETSVSIPKRVWATVGGMITAISLLGNVVTVIVVFQGWLPAMQQAIDWLLHLFQIP